MEFAVLKTGGKQYKVYKDDSIIIEKLGDSSKIGDKIIFENILLVDNGKETTIGTPFIKGAKVEATIEQIGRLPKIMVMHYKQKSRYFKKNGHRQPYFKIKINNIK